MRHGNKVNNLGRTASHRKAMLSNMACSLIEHKRINTTLAKAKALRGYVEPLLTKSKTDSTHNRRTVFSYLQSKEIVSELFRDVAPRIAERNGGYTRIIRTGYRLGDNAEMCMIELVDFNDVYINEKAKKNTRRSRRAGGAKKEGETTTATEAEVVETPEAAAPAAETAPEATAEVVEETAVESPVAEKVEETPAVEESKDEEAADESEEKEEEGK